MRRARGPADLPLFPMIAEPPPDAYDGPGTPRNCRVSLWVPRPRLYMQRAAKGSKTATGYLPFGCSFATNTQQNQRPGSSRLARLCYQTAAKQHPGIGLLAAAFRGIPRAPAPFAGNFAYW